MEAWPELWFNTLALLPALTLIAWTFVNLYGSKKPRKRRVLSREEKESLQKAAQRNAAQAQNLLEAFSIFPETPLREEMCWYCLCEDAGMTDADCSVALEELAKKGRLRRSWDADIQAVCFFMSRKEAEAIHVKGPVPLQRHRNLVNRCSRAYLPMDENESWLRMARSIAAYWKDEADISLTRLYHKIGICCHARGFHDEALACYETALTRNPAISEGNDLPAVLEIYHSIADLYRKRDAHDTALAFYKKSLSILERRLPPDDARLLDIYVCTADTYHSLEDWDSALCFYKKAQHAMKKAQPPLRLASLHSAMAVLYAKKGEYTKALRRFAWVLRIRETELGQAHLQTAWCLYNMAETQECMGNYDAAMGLYQDAYSRLSPYVYCGSADVLGDRLLFAARCLDRIALLYREQLYYKEALDASLRALHIRESSLEKKPDDMAQNCHAAADLYYTLEDYGKAASLYEQALSIWAAEYGADALQTALGCMAAAPAHSAKKDFSRALELYQRALSILEAYPDCNPLLPALCSKGIANAHRSCGRLDEAQSFFERTAGIAAQWRTLHPAMPDLLAEMQEVITDIKQQRESALPKGRLLAFGKGAHPSA